MIFLTTYKEPLWAAWLLIGIPVVCAVAAHFAERSGWTEEDKRLMKIYRDTWNKKPSAETDGTKTKSITVK